MVVLYLKLLGQFVAVAYASPDTDAAGLGCNECVWIVPGTMAA